MYLMNEDTNDLLTRVRAKMESKTIYDEAEIVGAFHIGETTIDVLERIRLEMMSYDAINSGEYEVETPDNGTDVDAALDLYLDSIVERLVEKGATDAEAVEFVFLVADHLEENGDLPPMPGEDSSDDEVSVWMGTAKTMGFTNKILSMAGML